MKWVSNLVFEDCYILLLNIIKANIAKWIGQTHEYLIIIDELSNKLNEKWIA